MENVYISLKISKELKDRIKVHCAVNGITMQDYLCGLIRRGYENDIRSREK
jgi:predicted DNA binding CopG/RHH family protein